jgi:hypothetical protein
MGKRVDNPKTTILSVRVTAEESAELARQAKKEGVRISDLLYRRLFGRAA